jgi:hypothetical protein
MVVQNADGMVQVVDSAFYPVRKNSRVTLTVEVGDGQAGGSSYTWQGMTVTGAPNFEDAEINPANASPVATVLHCATKVMDIRPETNQTSVTYTLKGGPQDRSFPYGVQVPAEHGIAMYLISFVFVSVA